MSARDPAGGAARSSAQGKTVISRRQEARHQRDGKRLNFIGPLLQGSLHECPPQGNYHYGSHCAGDHQRGGRHCTLQHQRLTIQGGGKATAVPSSPPGQGVQVLGEADWIVLIKGSPATFFELLADTQTAVDLMIRGFAS